MKERILVGLSGGVDSSVAALLLQEKGYQVEGLFMFNWAEDEQGYCTAAEDFQSAREVARALGIPLHQADFSSEYRRDVFDYFLQQLAAGRTPNPDMLCNRHIKFDCFLDHARRLGADSIATGHYAHVDGGRLFRPTDRDKDQSYFLALVDAVALQQCRFPLARLRKSGVRELAADRGLPTFDRPDSTGICFIGERPFEAFISEYLPQAAGGDIRDVDSDARLGSHRGLSAYTLGQRRGLGIGGVSGASEAPWYVVDKNLSENWLLVSQNPRHPRLLSREILLHKMVLRRAPETGSSLQIQYRHRQSAVPGTVTIEGDLARVIFASPQPSVTPGQYAALYEGDECLGAGEILERSTEG